jgi:outer membrane protein OmpA-like peptidoglycan-associated protein
MSALLALPLCAQQKSSGSDDGAGNATKPTEKTAGNPEAAANTSALNLNGGASNAVDAAAVFRNAFALPARPLATPFPAASSTSEEAPGRLVPRYEIAGMFYYINYNPGGPFSSFNTYGGAGSYTYNPSKWVGLTEELGWYHFRRNLSGVGTNGDMATFMAGPRLNLRKFDYFVPFAQFMLGVAHAGPALTGANPRNSLAVDAGGGVDIVINKNFAWRFAQLDYLMTNISGPSVGANANQNNLRLGSGLVVRWGLPKAAPPPPVHHPPVAACSANPTSVYAGSGDVVAIHVNASSPDNNPLTYSYTATGGTVDGNGPDARWNSAGLAVGTYTVAVKVDDGKGGTASCAVDIKVEQRPNRPPTATLSIERSPILPGEHTWVTCVGTDPDNDPLTYSYTVSGGKILGSGSKVEFDATGLQPGTYTVTCTVDDGRGGTAQASGTVEVKEPPQVKQLEVRLALHSIYFPTAQPTAAKPKGGLLASQAGTLDTLANDFKQYLAYRPNANLILEGHADIRGAKDYNQALSDRRVERTKSYLIEKGVPPDHLETKAFGAEKNMTDAEVRKLLDEDTTLSPAEKKKLLANLLTVELANNRRVDVTLSTTGEQSIRRFPFNAKDALTLISRRAEGTTGAKPAAKAPAAKKPAAKP